MLEKLNNIPTRYKVYIAIIVILGSYAAGRWASPVKTKTETKIVQDDSKIQELQKKLDTIMAKNTKITEDKKPDGTEHIVTIIDENTHTRDVTEDHSKDVASTTSDTTKEVTKESGKLIISVLGGLNFTQPGQYKIGGEVQHTIIGPLVGGVYGLSDGSCGITVGLMF